MLEAACARPQASVLGSETYPSLGLKAAALLQSLVRNHALVDDNKRLAWLAPVVFLDLSDCSMGFDDDSAFDLVMVAAEGHLDVEEIAERQSLVEGWTPSSHAHCCRN